MEVGFSILLSDGGVLRWHMNKEHTVWQVTRCVYIRIVMASQFIEMMNIFVAQGRL
jgi:hypothetical protein